MSLSAATDVPLAAAAPTVLTPEVVRTWHKEDVASWASKLGLDDEDVAKLVVQKIDGKRLLDVVTEEKLVKLYGMSGGAAGDVMNAVAKIKKAGGTASTDGGGAGGAGAGACG